MNKSIPIALLFGAVMMASGSDYRIWEATVTVYGCPTTESFEHLQNDMKALEDRIKNLEDQQPKPFYEGEIINNPVRDDMPCSGSPMFPCPEDRQR